MPWVHLSSLSEWLWKCVGNCKTDMDKLTAVLSRRGSTQMVNSKCRRAGRCTQKRTWSLLTREPSISQTVTNTMNILVDADLAFATSGCDYRHAVFRETYLRLPCLLHAIQLACFVACLVLQVPKVSSGCWPKHTTLKALEFWVFFPEITRTKLLISWM